MGSGRRVIEHPDRRGIRLIVTRIGGRRVAKTVLAG
jgi:hypothetical protein